MAPDDRACGACGFRPDTVTPGDAIVALRSFPRRWRELLLGVEAAEVGDDLVRQRLPGMWSALDHGIHVSQGLAVQADSLQRVRDLDSPSLGPIETRPVGADHVVGVHDVLAELARNAERLATAAESMAGQDWLRRGERAGHQVTSLDLLRQGVHEGVHHLHEAARLLRRLGGRWPGDEGAP
ncbi:MAG: hypothetical protein M3N28_01110 [Actinomycetota bacterium]|nr:hypothetical protein [Actinomycetota bacterium]